jgi:O-antigen biosynthesis protein
VSGTQKKDLPAGILQKQLDLPFDQYQGYRIVADVIDRLREDPDPLQILDAGGEDGILSGFLPEDRVTVLDRRAAEDTASALPYEDQAFDYTVSVDIYARIEPGLRYQYLSELRRVTQKGVLVAAPFDSDVVRGAERVANEFHRAIQPTEEAQPLGYERDELPPTLEDVRRFFEEHDDTISVLPNGYVPHWLAMTCLASYGSKLEGDLDGILGHVNAFYNETIYEVDNAEPAYRHLLVALKGPSGADLADVASPGRHPEHASRSAALFGALSAVLPSMTEVSKVNARLAQRERQAAQKEGVLARREAQINDLSRRLAEQLNAKNSLLETEQRARELQKNVRELRQSHNNLRQENALLKRQKDDLQQRLARVANSRAWRLLNTLNRLRLRLLRSG